MVAYIFPGQGSQRTGMCQELFDEFPVIIQQAERILGYSITELIMNAESNKLDNTYYTQPALYIVNALSYYKILHQGTTKASYFAGHSLGEFNALLAANVFDFTTGLLIVQKRAELMSQMTKGKMAAVIGLNISQVEKLLQQDSLSKLVIANYNTKEQIVVSGISESIDNGRKIFEEAGGRFIPLKVSGAFHSPLMREAEDKFKDFLTQFNFNEPDIPVIANLDAKPYSKENLAYNMTSQISHTVCWFDSINYILRNGVSTFIELWPSGILSRMTQSIKDESETYA